MRCRGFWLPILAVTLWASSAGSNAWADDYWVETVDWVPTSSVSILPTSYLAATSYVLPTSYSVPTVYATAYATERVLTPTSYVVPSYYETRFRRSIFGRRLIPSAIGRYTVPTGLTSYTPTTYYAPTSYFPTTLYYPTAYYVPTTYRTVPTVIDRSVVATEYVRESSLCCDDATPIAMAPARTIAPERSSESSARRPRRSVVQSEPEEDDAPSLPSDVEPTPAPVVKPRVAPENNAGVRKPAEAAKTETPKETTGSPPNPPAPERRDSAARPEDTSKQAITPAPEPSKATEPALPKAPSGVDEFLNEPAPLPTAPDEAGTRSESRKPVYDPARAFRTESRNVLFGRVRERETREPEEGVRVLLSNRTNTFDDRVAMTDAFGRFAVRVPDGDWTVKVTMPSGRVYSVSEITVSNGQISDDQGRDVPSLTITR
ncbi:carboxypeptidase regulatory-like domain-containing protein [Paludisphaera borealis]|uniref:Carboxypeptidase regulatory-like domain-containing protein n=1 Tax=Paludisphaera borealis TaxID=1387353 RepID=A0A1U7CY34_9BACT|nr:carboxypeptidase regulatory-like domain-containing protein [Paludisphaera borealis]APW63789.1 hypothetical protein BSF38_05366 [Paludisphaera borealis]